MTSMYDRRLAAPLISRLLIAAIAASAAGCTTFYIPPAAHMPLLSNSGEAHLGAYVSGSTGDAQLSWSPLPGLGILAAGMYSGDLNNGANISRYAELMGLYYIKPRKALRLEVAAGMGKGTVDYVGNGGPGTFVDGRFNRYVAQIDLGLTRDLNSDYDSVDGGDHFLIEFGIGLRVAYLDPYDVQDIIIEELPGPGGGTLRETRTPTATEGSMFYEPAVMFRAGPQYLQVEGQLVLSKDFGHFDFNHRALAISLGIRVGLGKRTMF